MTTSRCFLFWTAVLQFLLLCYRGTNGELDLSSTATNGWRNEATEHSAWNRELLQFDAATLGEEQPSFRVCWNALNEASANKMEVNKSDYLEFLNLVSQGHMSDIAFEELEFIQVTIFYAAACQNPLDCIGTNEVSIKLASSGESFGSIVALCYSVMRELTVSVKVKFGAGIEFNPQVVPRGSIGSCLGLASQAALLDTFGCDVIPSRRGLRHSESLRGTVSSLPQLPSSNMQAIPRPTLRHLETLPSCPFDVTVKDLSSLFIPCPSPKGSLLCGDVFLEVAVITSQLERPIYDDFVIEVTDVLEKSVKSRTIRDYFPEGCT